MLADRVLVATCHDRAEAIEIREALEAHGIDAVVSSESHAPPGLAGLATGYVSFEIWVAHADGEQAAALLGDEHDAEHGDAPDPDGDAVSDSPAAIAAVHALERRKRTGVALLLSFAITFGTGHLYTRAWLRGITLAAIEIVGFGQLSAYPPLGALLIGLAVACDAAGSTLRVRAATAPGAPMAALPAARIVSR